HLLGDAVGVTRDEVLDLQARGLLGRAQRAHLRRVVVALELGERARRRDLAQPRRLAGERLRLAALELACDEDEEAERREPEEEVLEVAAEGRDRRRRSGRRRLRERDLADAQRVAARRDDPRRARDRSSD